MLKDILSKYISKGISFIAKPIIVKLVNVVLLGKSLGVIEKIAIFSLTERSSKYNSAFGFDIISIGDSTNLIASTLSSTESNLILGVPVKVTGLL